MRGSAQSMASVAKTTLAYYAANTLTSVLLGMMLVSLLRPGRGSPLSSAAGSCAVNVTEVITGAGQSLHSVRGSAMQLWGQRDGGDVWGWGMRHSIESCGA